MEFGDKRPEFKFQISVYYPINLNKSFNPPSKEDNKSDYPTELL